MDFLAGAGAALVTSVGSSTTTTVTGLVPVLAFAAAIPLAFYVIKQIIGLIPKSRARTH